MSLLGVGEPWSAPDFTESEYAERHRRIRVAMAEQGIDVLIALDPRSIHYLTGYRGKSYQEFQCVFFLVDDRPLTVVTRVAEVLEYQQLALVGDIYSYADAEWEDPIASFATALHSLDVGDARLGCEYPEGYLTRRDHREMLDVMSSRRVVDATNLIMRVKRVKSPAEIAMMRTATQMIDQGMETAIEALVPGRTEHEVGADIYRTILAAGSDVPPSPINIGSGDRTALGHPLPSERVLRSGDFLHIEFGASYHRYTTSIGRNLCLGEPTSLMKEIHGRTLEACDALIAAVRPGISSAIPHEAARKVMIDSGWEYARLHCSGFELGTAFPPSFFGGAMFFGASEQYPSDILEEGMLITVEPPLFAADKGIGARLIDNILVTATGAEILSSTQRELIRVD